MEITEKQVYSLQNPQRIEAIYYDGSEEVQDRIKQWLGDKYRTNILGVDTNQRLVDRRNRQEDKITDIYFLTLAGEIGLLTPGNYIIKLQKHGEFVRMPEESFKKHYKLETEPCLTKKDS